MEKSQLNRRVFKKKEKATGGNQISGKFGCIRW